MTRELNYVCIGLDIGTARTKVVLHLPYMVGEPFYLVDFGKKGEEGAEYLLPTRVKLENGIYELPEYNEEDPSVLTNLKVNFMWGRQNALTHLRAFIALVIKETKRWFTEKHGEDDAYKGKGFDWSVNMGIPTASFNEEGENERYLDLLKEAYELSNHPSTLFDLLRGESREKVSATATIRKDNETELHIVPEIVAAVQSFLKQDDDDKIRSALYCAIDIGAGTSDVCTFKIFAPDGDEKYAFFKSSVQELGAERYYDAKNKDVFLQEFREQIGSVIWQTKLRRAPNEPEWKSYFPIVLCGGGSYIQEYKDQLEKFNQEALIGQAKGKGITYINLPQERLIFPKKYDPKRVIVSQGLSYPQIEFEEIKKYYRETEIDDTEPQGPIDITERYIEK